MEVRPRVIKHKLKVRPQVHQRSEKRKKEEKEKEKKKVVISFLTQFVCFENTFHVFMEKQVCFSIEIIHETFPRPFSF